MAFVIVKLRLELTDRLTVLVAVVEPGSMAPKLTVWVASGQVIVRLIFGLTAVTTVTEPVAVLIGLPVPA